MAQVPLELQELAQLELSAEAQRLVLQREPGQVLLELVQLELSAEAQRLVLQLELQELESQQGARAGS